MTLFEEQFHAQSLGAEGLQVQAPYRLQEPTNMLSYRSLHTPFTFFIILNWARALSSCL